MLITKTILKRKENKKGKNIQAGQFGGLNQKLLHNKATGTWH
jgi:hypothetical protein